jgi:hypothetical protein
LYLYYITDSLICQGVFEKIFKNLFQWWFAWYLLPTPLPKTPPLDALIVSQFRRFVKRDFTLFSSEGGLLSLLLPFPLDTIIIPHLAQNVNTFLKNFSKFFAFPL